MTTRATDYRYDVDGPMIRRTATTYPNGQVINLLYDGELNNASIG